MPKKTCLILAAAPIDQGALRLDAEARDLREQLRQVQDARVEVVIEHRWAVRTDQIQMELLNATPSVLHFSGHGDTGLLVFEDRTGSTSVVSANAFAGLIAAAGGVECVLLNACFSESIADAVVPHVQVVIGCDDSIADNAAIAFSRAFYRAMAHGRSYVSAFELARNEVQLNGMEDEAAKYKITHK